MNSPRVSDFGSLNIKNENSKIYFDYLDSLRFFAFLAVFIAHTGILFPISADWFYWLYRNVISHGAYGVNFFFVLSGFLITYLLLREKDRSNQIDINFFYLKRVLRIWPVYFIVFLFSIFVLPLIVRFLGAEHLPGTGQTFVNLGMVTSDTASVLYLFLVGNFVQAYELGLVPFALGVLWSVCVEEQFYLIWPWIIKAAKRRAIFVIAWMLFFLSLIYRAFHINDANIAYYSTLSVAMDLASGALLAAIYFFGKYGELFRFKKTELKAHDKLNILFLIALNVSLISILIMYLHANGTGLAYDFLRLMKRPVIDILFVGILVYFLNRKNRTEPIREIGLSYRPFTYLGRISYGLYAYHAIAIICVLSVFNHFGLGPNDVGIIQFVSIFVLSIVLTICMSHFSYQFLEKRILMQRARFIRINRAKGARF